MTTTTTSDWEEEDRWEAVSGKTIAGVDARERHKLAERERRKSMRELFLSLHGLLPHSHAVRKEQSAILDELIAYIPVAQSRLRSLHSRLRPSSAAPPSPAPTTVCVSGGDCDIRVAPKPASSVAIRVRGDRVNVSLTDAKGSSQAVLLSAVLDELEAHHLVVVRSIHCRDGSKLLHHSESKICDGMERSPELLKARLQGLAGKLHELRKSSSFSSTSSSSSSSSSGSSSYSSPSSLKRRYDQIV